MKVGNARKLYLVRHGNVDFSQGIQRCIGRTEIPLSEMGRQQARELGEYFGRHPVTEIFTSPLGRCLETAEIMAAGNYPIRVESGLQELDMGEWENVPMKQLRKELESEPEQGEGREAGLLRFRKAIEGILEQTKGDIVCVAHAGVNCCYLSMLLGTPLETSRALPQPYGGFSLILADDSGNMRVTELGVMPKDLLDVWKCEEDTPQ